MHGVGESFRTVDSVAHLTDGAPAGTAPRAPARVEPVPASGLRPALSFWIAGLIIYGLAALNFAGGHFLDQTSRDLWQHLAALRTLIADPFDPSNPFVPTGEGSRHFHPYWVAVAFVARAFGWNEWQAIAAAGFVSGGVLLAGIWTFARSFYRSAWGPLALLAAMVLGWSLPISHTGYHSVQTMIEGIAYPASLLVGLSLLLWALVIRALEQPSRAVLIVPLTAFMFATHQLGAGIGFVAAGCFILLWPHGSLKARAAAGGAMAAGLLLATAWPYHSPFEAIARTGNPSWTGGLEFYSPRLLFMAGVPALIGLWGLCHPRFARTARPVLLAFALFAAIFAAGAYGPMIFTRFVMPAVLMLHIGMGALFIILGEGWRTMRKAWQLGLFGFAVACLHLHVTATVGHLAWEVGVNHETGDTYAAARALTRDIPDAEPVAAYDVAAWPVVATGQHVVSVPWPEPMITGLAERQSVAERLFDPGLSREERLGLARRWGVRHLIIDRRGPIRRVMPEGLLKTLEQQAAARRESGTFIRFDLE